MTFLQFLQFVSFGAGLITSLLAIPFLFYATKALRKYVRGF